VTLEEAVAHRSRVVADVQSLLVDHLLLEVEPGDLDPDAPLFGSGHGLDSIDAVEIVVAVENRFRVKLQEQRVLSIPHMRTVNTIADLVIAEEGT